MKRTLILASTALVALVATGFAVAHGIDGTKSAKLVSGTFATGVPSQFKTRSCTTSDGKTLVATEGVYTGTAAGTTAGNTDLTGPITVKARSLINSTDGVGVVSGTLKIDVASGGDTVAHFDTVYSAGQIAGLASGHAQDPHAKLLGNLSSAFNFSSTGGFGSGKLGGGTSGGAAVELGPGKCEPTKAVKETSEARGIVAASGTSVTVASLTCTVPTSLQAKVTSLVGLRAEIRCSLSGSVNTLVKIDKK
jgi:hypothetical protein